MKKLLFLLIIFPLLFTNCNNDPVPLSIGDFHEGGIIFHLDGSGEHGMVCDIQDLGTYYWGSNCYGYTIQEIYGFNNGSAIGTGYQNTIDIVNQGCSTAELCYSSTQEGYDDWFLPSKDELNQMYMYKASINATAPSNGGDALALDYYLSSTEYFSYKAHGQRFSSGEQVTLNKNESHKVRAVREF